MRMRDRALGMSLAAVVVLAVTGIGGLAAQDASPAGGDAFAALAGVPELTITLTDGGLEGVPAETPAGWTLVTFTNSVTPTGDPFEDSWSVEVLQLPEGKTVDDLAAV